ncbi:MAG: RNA-directed DNA polymerase, partial [Actinomycetia bacterium]|nr:RNA-directed DNA polymerase [Actinomycetes bacterium]
MEWVANLIVEYQDVFVGADGKVGYTDIMTHKIDTGKTEPIKARTRKKSFVERDHITKEVAKMLSSGQIQPSNSPWGAAVVLAKKKDNTLRFCVDYRLLNGVTKKDAYPLPKIEECLDKLGGNKYFHTMDMASGYWQVKMEPKDSEKTAFCTPVGLFEWLIMPFGLC